MMKRHSMTFSAMVFMMTAIPMSATAQTELRVEAQTTVSTGDNTPLWLNANKYGLSSLDLNNGYVRMGLFHPTTFDEDKKTSFGYGADVAMTYNNTSSVVVQQAFVEARWLKGVMTIGSKQQPMMLKNQQLSSGAQTLGVNARPVPSLRVALPEYWTVPYTRGLLALKGHVAYGMQTDDRWQKDFTHRQSKYTEHALIHTKAGYLRIGNPARPFTVELGLEMGTQFGGTSYIFDNGNEKIIDNDASISGFLHAFIPAGGDKDENNYKNKEGNHVGSYLLRVNYEQPTYAVALYADHFFEDSSQMLFFEFDGYGKGERYNEWEDSRWFLYRLKDMMLGVEVNLKKCKWVNNLLCEYIYTKYQSGPVYHDRTPSLSDHVGGRDNYYNHYMHTGWQHWGQVMGNPLYRSPLYNDNGQVKVLNNRFVAWHAGLSGQPTSQLRYRLLTTWLHGLGTYEDPAVSPQCNVSVMAEADYSFPKKSALEGWEIRMGVGHDHGGWTGNNTGVQFTIGKRLTLKH